MRNAPCWWQAGVIYHVVVPSFLDTNGDGLGDLEGVIARLKYLRWLGVDALWLSPIYPSPFRDLGYDITDFTNVDPRYGSLETFDRLLDESHRLGLAVILDWVPAHTSSEHPWFIESSGGRDAGRRDWYVWADPAADGGPPNNWISVFGGSAWDFHEPTGQYYLHTFHPTQPDLNWHNGDVRRAMLDTLTFWLERGVDGFRIDACCLLLKDKQLRDNPPNPDFRDGDGPDSRLLPRHTRDQPGLHELLADLRARVEHYGDRVLLGELYLPLDRIAAFYGSERQELHLPLNMQLSWADWRADTLAHAIGDYFAAVDGAGWPAVVLATHDAPRIAARAGPEQARLASMLLLTLRGTPILYYGEEIGMRGVAIPPEDARDPQGRRTGRNRDPERTPMQWNGHEANAGFTAAEPWLPVADDLARINVLAQSNEPGSLLHLYRELMRLRAASSALSAGGHEQHDAGTTEVFAYRRVHGSESALILLNFANEPRDARCGEWRGRLALSTRHERSPGEPVGGQVGLGPFEGVLVTLD